MTRARPRASGRISERAFHAWLARTLPAGRRGPLPLGDDTAALPIGGGRVLLLTTDALVEGTHFLPDSPPAAVGEAAVAVSLSDIASKGGRPTAVLLALLVPPTTPTAWARAVLMGAERTARRYGCHVVGGDTKAAPQPTLVSMVVGVGRLGALAPRSGARPGDLLVTTGDVGRGGRAALRFARRPSRAALLGWLSVVPRVREGQALAPMAHAMLDTSDGIAESAWLLAEASRARIVVELARIPWAKGLGPAPRRPTPNLAAAFFGGDYELLAAVPPACVAQARRAVRGVGGTLTVVGRVEPGGGAWLEGPAGRTALPRAGWQPLGR